MSCAPMIRMQRDSTVRYCVYAATFFSNTNHENMYCENSEIEIKMSQLQTFKLSSPIRVAVSHEPQSRISSVPWALSCSLSSAQKPVRPEAPEVFRGAVQRSETRGQVAEPVAAELSEAASGGPAHMAQHGAGPCGRWQDCAAVEEVGPGLS